MSPSRHSYSCHSRQHRTQVNDSSQPVPSGAVVRGPLQNRAFDDVLLCHDVDRQRVVPGEVPVQRVVVVVDNGLVVVVRVRQGSMELGIDSYSVARLLNGIIPAVLIGYHRLLSPAV